MGDQRISRRAIVPGLAVGAATALAPISAVDAAPVLGQISAQAPRRRRVTSTLGPCRVFRGHSLAFQVFIPPGSRVVTQPNDFHLVLLTMDGATLVQHQFQLQAGRGTEMTLDVLQDGSLQFNGQSIVGDWDSDGRGDAIIAILIGLLLPAVQAARATVTSFIAGGAGERPQVNYTLTDVLVSS